MTLTPLITDVMGNIIEARDSLGAATPTREYAYDALYRLTRVEDGTGALMEDYAYTKTGDRTLKQLGNQAPQVYAYLAGTHHLASIDGTGRYYDANGNTLSTGNGVQFSYDDRNRRAMTSIPMAQANSATAGGIAAPSVADETVYRYNGRGERIETDFTLLLDIYSYAFDESGHHLGEYKGGVGTNGEEIIYLDDVPVAMISGKAIRYLETDHLGTPRLAASSTDNAVQWHWDFFADAFGGNTPTTPPGGISLSLRYPGQFAEVGGVNYNYFRDYEAGTGRYIESDPIGLEGGISTYSYGINNAVLYFDAYGLCGEAFPSNIQKYCAKLSIPSPPKCISSEECFKRAATCHQKCIRATGMIMAQFLCTKCCEAYEAQCPNCSECDGASGGCL
jgi:RHS repeat-associated protein